MQNDDEAWRAIVENYGERADLKNEPAAEDAAPDPEPDPGPILPSPRTWDEATVDSDWANDRFVPPPPPPVPSTTTDRKLAWFGLFGSPAVLLLSLVLGIALPSFIATLLVVWFVGGFVYLVLLMPSGPRDPGDDGARL